MGALLKSPIGLAIAAALVAWWFLRKKAECHCDHPATATTPGDPPISTVVTSTLAPPPETTSITPWVDPRPLVPWNVRCTQEGGSPGWDPTTNSAFCAHPDLPSIWTDVAPQPASPVLDCHGLGGVTLPDGSCCVPPACTPGYPSGGTPPPVVVTVPPPIWGGYDSDPYGNRSGGGAPYVDPTWSPRLKCEGTGGRFIAAGGNGDYCSCPAGTHASADGYCTTNIG